MKGKIHSIETLGTVDGPGIRFVVFMQGCNLRCLYCHNPDTWQTSCGEEKDTDEILKQILKYKNYLKNGGVTVSGGEPLLQIDFVLELFKKLKENEIHTCLDTSGNLFDTENQNFMEKIEKLIKVTDLFLLDIKQINPEKHKKLTGKSNENILKFVKYLNDNNKFVWIRYVLVPSITDDEEDILKTKSFLSEFRNIQKVEILPYHNMGKEKYDKLEIEFSLKDIPIPTEEQLKKAKKLFGLKE